MPVFEMESEGCEVTATKHISILGAGAVGLAVAYELLKRGCKVTVIDLAGARGGASWAGAGILVPASAISATHLLDRLAGLSNELHRQWSAELFQLTGIDNQYQRCGGVYLARTAGETAVLHGQLLQWQDEGVEATELPREQLPQILGPHWQPATPVIHAVYLPDERQIRNPHHLRALETAIIKLGGTVRRQETQCRVEAQANRLQVFINDDERLPCDDVCVTAGAWSQSLLANAGATLPLTPVRGQMLLFQLDKPLGCPIVNDRSRYIVPRRDGFVLVGSTVEEVGFDAAPTAAGIATLQQFAQDYFPILSPDRCVQQWAGLRPASYDGMPYLGRVSGFENAWVATGHFRIGLQLSPITAQLIGDLILGYSPPFDLELFSPQRLHCPEPPS